MATMNIILIFCYIVVIAFIVKLIMFLKTKIQNWSLENKKSKQDREEIKQLLKEIKEELKNNK